MTISKKDILALFDETDAALHFSQLLRTFGGRHLKRELKAVLDDLVSAGVVSGLKGNSYILASAKLALRGRISLHRDGYGFVTPEKGGDDVFIPQRHTKGAMNGDLVEVSSIQSRVGGGKREGRVNALLERATKRVVGRYEENRRVAVVIPDDQRVAAVLIPAKWRGNAEDGHQVVVELKSYPIGGRPAEGQIVEILGWPDDPEVEVQSVIRRFGLSHVFAEDVILEADAAPDRATDADFKGRIDLRAMQTITIDGESARDFDDAVSLRREETNYRLWVSIADVSHYVKPDSALDREAYLRGTSVYFPDRCIPMLPERLSNGICSLNPDLDRLTVTAEMLFDKNGKVIESSFYSSVIKSSARLTYTVVRDIILDSDAQTVFKYRQFVAMLMDMKELALTLQKMRLERGSIDFELPEPEIIIGADGATEGIVRAERNLAHQLIEEFMLAANEAVARFITERGSAFLYRVHENPDTAKLQMFQEFIYGFGYELKLTENRADPSGLQRILGMAKGKSEERMINYAMLRCMKQARYAAENLGHFGLASSCYCHFTSPIRRYPDLVVHRILKAQLVVEIDKTGKQALRRLETATEKLAEIAEYTSKCERVAMDAERDVVEMKKVQYMQQHIGEEFDGFISGVTGFGFFVELDELFVEGLVHLSTLDNDIYRYVEKQHSLIGSNSRHVFRIGDKLRVKLAAVLPATRRIEFTLVSHLPTATPNQAVLHLQEDEYPHIPLRGKRLPRLGQGSQRKPDFSNPKDKRNSTKHKRKRR